MTKAEIEKRIEELECEAQDNEDLAGDYDMSEDIREISRDVAKEAREEISLLRQQLAELTEGESK